MNARKSTPHEHNCCYLVLFDTTIQKQSHQHGKRVLCAPDPGEYWHTTNIFLQLPFYGDPNKLYINVHIFGRLNLL